MAQKLFIWSRYHGGFSDGGNDELREELKNGWRVVNSQSVRENNEQVHYILEKFNRKDKLEQLEIVSQES